MFYIIITLLIISITQGFILLEEELLIIVASIVWVDAAGNLIKNLIENEVEVKSKLIKDKYEWFLLKKKESFNNLLNLYLKRLIFSNQIKKLEKDIIILLINNNILYFLTNFLILKEYNIIIKLINVGLLLIKKNFSQEVINILKILKKNTVYLKKYILLNYLITPVANIANFDVLVYNKL
jgi:hypothetical protein